MKIESKSAKETKRIGKALAKKILNLNLGGKAILVCLKGDLGGGKTTFAQGFARGLGIKEKILSPTFVILKRFANFYHLDCYRIKKPEDILELGFKEIVSDPKNIILIEWPEKIKKILPKNPIIIKFEFLGRNKRIISIDLDAQLR